MMVPMVFCEVKVSLHANKDKVVRVRRKQSVYGWRIRVNELHAI